MVGAKKRRETRWRIYQAITHEGAPSIINKSLPTQSDVQPCDTNRWKCLSPTAKIAEAPLAEGFGPCWRAARALDAHRPLEAGATSWRRRLAGEAARHGALVPGAGGV